MLYEDLVDFQNWKVNNVFGCCIFNKSVSMSVQANRIKIYIDPGYRPIDPLKDDNDEPYLDLDQLPEDSFREEEHHFDYGGGPTEDKIFRELRGDLHP